MAVRRLAEEEFQPGEFKFTRAKAAEADKWIAKYPEGRQQSAVIPLLMLAQEQDGWVTRAAIEHVAATLSMPLIRVMEVATFYTQFQLKPVGTRAHVQVCGTTPCMLRGSEDLMKVCQRKIHHDQFARNEAGTLSWEEVECQGACVNAPMVMIGADTYEDLTPERLEQIIDAFESGKGADVPAGTQIDRIYSAPAGGLTTLTDGQSGKTGARKSGKANPDQKMTKAAKPNEVSPEGDPSLKDPAHAKGPGRSKASKSTDPKTEDASPTLKVATTAKSVRPKATKSAKTDEAGNPTMKIASTASGVSSAKSAPLPERRTKAAPKRDDSRKVAVKKTPKEQPEPETYDKSKPNPTMRVASTSSAVRPGKGRPQAVDKPDHPDDLKMISGVGPKIEEKLNGLGIYTFAQIAKWNAAERAWVDSYLSFHGRIDRDEWIKQAKALAKGGRDEYVRVFGKEPR